MRGIILALCLLSVCTVAASTASAIAQDPQCDELGAAYASCAVECLLPPYNLGALCVPTGFLW